MSDGEWWDPSCLHVSTAWELVKREIRSRPEGVGEVAMQEMNVLFEKHLGAALEILDKGWVSKVRTESNRELFIVKGKSESQYVVIADFCPCQYFASSVATGEVHWCKHLIAVQLRDCQQPPLRAKLVSDADFRTYLTTRLKSTHAVSPSRKGSPKRQ